MIFDLIIFLMVVRLQVALPLFTLTYFKQRIIQKRNELCAVFFTICFIVFFRSIAITHPPTAGHLPPIAITHPSIAITHPPTAEHLPPVAVTHPPTAEHLPSIAITHPPTAEHLPSIAITHPPTAEDLLSVAVSRSWKRKSE